jgi:adenosylcobinamide kinase/adenosylcobinamide-phosphate guanylyltransferase
MAEITLLIGGARSGKSSYALRLAKDSGSQVMYLAPGIPCDDEMKDRIERHRRDRPRGWQTIEETIHLKRALADTDDSIGLVLFDDLSFWVSNLLVHYQDQGKGKDQIEKLILGRVSEFFNVAKEHELKLIVVSNEVGMGIVPNTPLGRIYRDILGWTNQLAASHADRVFLLVAGLPTRIK